MRAFGATIGGAAPTPTLTAARTLVPTRACTTLPERLVYLSQATVDASHLRPPADYFTPFGQDRYTAGRYVVVPTSAWRDEYRKVIASLFSTSGVDGIKWLVDCLLPSLVQITDLTKGDLFMALNADVPAVTGGASLLSTLSVTPRLVTGTATTGGSTTGGARTATPTTGEKTADTQQQITGGRGQQDVVIPPAVTPEHCAAQGWRWDAQSMSCLPPVADEYGPPGPGPAPPPPGPAAEKAFPWVPVVVGVVVVGGIGVYLLSKKKKKR